MNTFTIRVFFRQDTPYLKSPVVLGSAPEGIITISSHRCHVEAVLSHMNVARYQIIECDNALQIMREPIDMPGYYYEEA